MKIKFQDSKGGLYDTPYFLTIKLANIPLKHSPFVILNIIY